MVVDSSMTQPLFENSKFYKLPASWASPFNLQAPIKKVGLAFDRQRQAGEAVIDGRIQFEPLRNPKDR
jgi:hypothetical protein